MRSVEIPSLRDRLAKRDMLLRAGVPVRQHHHRFRTALESRARRKVARMHRVVFAIRRVDGGRKAQPGVLDAEIGSAACRRRTPSLCASASRFSSRMRVSGSGVIGLDRPAGSPVETPVERPHHAVGGTRREIHLPGVHAPAVPGFYHSETRVHGLRSGYRMNVLTLQERFLALLFRLSREERPIEEFDKRRHGFDARHESPSNSFGVVASFGSSWASRR